MLVGQAYYKKKMRFNLKFRWDLIFQIYIIDIFIYLYKIIIIILFHQFLFQIF